MRKMQFIKSVYFEIQAPERRLNGISFSNLWYQFCVLLLLHFFPFFLRHANFCSFFCGSFVKTRLLDKGRDDQK